MAKVKKVAPPKKFKAKKPIKKEAQRKNRSSGVERKDYNHWYGGGEPDAI